MRILKSLYIYITSIFAFAFILICNNPLHRSMLDTLLISSVFVTMNLYIILAVKAVKWDRKSLQK